MPAVKELSLTYDAINDELAFSEGDLIGGEVTMVLGKDTKIETLFVKAKGDAKVHWSEKHGDKTHNYRADRRVFKEKQILIAEQEKGTIFPAGVHKFKYKIQIPNQSMPSSFRADHAKVVYRIEAKLCRSWRLNKEDSKEFRFWQQPVPYLDCPKAPQRGSTNKEMGLFSSGSVHMEATVDKAVYSPGDTVYMVANINNSSSKDMSPKFSLIRIVDCRAQGHSKHMKDVICKYEGNVISPRSQKEVSCSFKIPTDTHPTIDNLDILSVSYQVKVYLDISFSFDPEVLFPVIITPRRSFPKPVPDISVNSDRAGPMWGNDFQPPAARSYPPSPSAPMYPPIPPQHPTSPMHPPIAPQYPTSPMHPPIAPQYPTSPMRPPQYPASPTNYPPQYPNPSPSSTPLPPPSTQAEKPQITPTPDNDAPVCPTAPVFPTFDPVQPSAPLMTADFLSSSDEPPSYEIVFPTSFGSGANSEENK